MSGKLILHKDAGYHGWLANQMLQISACVGIARKNGLEPVFADTGYYDKNFYSWFKGPFNLMSVEEIAKIECVEISEPHFHYHDFQLDPTKNYNLNGYFQSPKYWQHCEDEVRGMFEFSDIIKNKSSIPFHQLQSSVGGLNFREIHTVSIHVRRGDYLKHPNEHPVMPIGYYNKAAQTIDTTESVYIVFSDDIAWCKENFTHDILKGRILFVEGNTPVGDLCLLSLCQRHIISNSTFSWVGAYLSKSKTIVAPKKENWFGVARKDWNVSDLYLPEFIEI
jgi:hypothetical protein